MKKVNTPSWINNFKYNAHKLYRNYQCVVVDDVAFKYNCCFIVYLKKLQK